MLGVVLPGSSAAIKSSQSGHIGVIGDPMTIALTSMNKIKHLATTNECLEFYLVLVCPIVESNEINSVWLKDCL